MVSLAIIIFVTVCITLHKAFNSESEPEAYIDLEYKREAGFFPEPIRTEDNDNNDE